MLETQCSRYTHDAELPGLSARRCAKPRPAPLLTTRSRRMQCLLDELSRVARSSSTVLIQGESGTGKEVLARALHERSPRRVAPFVSVSCASLPEGVLESELFGHERGAFTGAVRQHLGRFELAHEGTLFLDEIGAADARVQLRLLRVLQEREFERVGGSRTIYTDVRVVAATNVDLRAEVRAGRFRQDLFYRLNVLPLELPPLRDRREDVPLLVDHFLAVLPPDPVAGPWRIEPEAVAVLLSYPWPGNVRELENTLENMAVYAVGGFLRQRDIPAQVAEWRDDVELEELGAVLFREAQSCFERRFLCDALRRHHGVVAHTAGAIGMSRKNLYSRMSRLEIDYDRYRR